MLLYQIVGTVGRCMHTLPVADYIYFDGIFSSMGAGAGPETDIICSLIDLVCGHKI